MGGSLVDRANISKLEVSHAETRLPSSPPESEPLCPPTPFVTRFVHSSHTLDLLEEEVKFAAVQVTGDTTAGLPIVSPTEAPYRRPFSDFQLTNIDLIEISPPSYSNPT